MTNIHRNDEPGFQKFTSAYGNKRQQFGEFYLPEQSGVHPVVILIHGGFWRAPHGLSLMSGLAEDLVQRGIAVWNIEYRRVGDPGGGWPGTLQDVARAADYLKRLAKTFPIDLQRVVAVGHSAGGHLALWLAARRQFKPGSILTRTTPPLELVGIISQAGVSDLTIAWHEHLGGDAVVEFLGGELDEVPERYTEASPTSFLPLGLPQVLIHGTDDTRVPLSMSQSYLAHAIEAGDDVHLITLEGADHFVVIDAASLAWKQTVSEIESLLEPASEHL
ncbi:alpha/beta hydrolase family protein [Tengunoibacter tsumagoiensis]|uniref:BD-FAE-like domain-containing protein n=1 Tax=Tengunoibacter tsumagoiensis TaxID=2014871 RepID=A0A402A6P0_9CHLR|nr:alpha/beta hydrolase [Tengunoibacter tsumagoiensis]GCE14802.1 hypothetical protein KTT_46610 [Tengunoibacter tsumagoiensis]